MSRPMPRGTRHERSALGVAARPAIPSVLLAMLLLCSTARADVVPPPPEHCPPGHTPSTGHGGPYCAPPAPSSCPPGYSPEVFESTAYCEPPPDGPCPPGANWTSLSAEDAFCYATGPCEQSACAAGETCVPTSFCLAWTCFRCSMTRILSLCRTDADCPAESHAGFLDPDGPKCVRGYRCEPKTKAAAPSHQGPRRQPLPTPIDLGVLPKHELAGCGYQGCPSGQLCLPLSLCVAQTGAASPQPGVTPVLGSCEHEARCPENSVCTRSFRCVDPQVLRPTRNGRRVTSEPRPTGRLPRAMGPGSGASSLGSAGRGGCAGCATANAKGVSVLWLAGCAGLLAARVLVQRARRRRPGRVNRRSGEK